MFNFFALYHNGHYLFLMLRNKNYSFFRTRNKNYLFLECHIMVIIFSEPLLEIRKIPEPNKRKLSLVET